MGIERKHARAVLAGVLVILTLAGGRNWNRGVVAAASVNGITAGEFIVDPPTLINLGFEWLIEGDDNRNASVVVSFRKQGSGEWKPGMPLLRLQGERIKQGDQLDVTSFWSSQPQLPVDQMLRITDAPGGEILSAAIGPGGAFVTVVALDGVHGLSIASMVAQHMLVGF